MGVAVLAKGPVGMVLPTAVIGMYLLIVRLHPVTRWRLETASAFDSVALLSDDPQRNRTKVPGWLVRCARPFGPVHFVRTCWSMRPITAMVVVLVVALPWYVLVGWHTEGAWPRGFFLEHNLGRATAAMEGHRGGIWFYPLALLVGFFPWSVFAVPVVLELVARLRVRGRWWRGYALLTCWVAVYVGLFTIAQTKLPSYVTPCYPALALLTACFFEHWRRGNLQAAAFWPQCAFLSLGLVGVMMVTALPFAAQRFLPGEEWLGGVGVIPVVGAAVALWLTRLSQIRAAQYAMGLTAVFTTTAFFAWAAVRVDLRRQEPALLAAVARQQPDSRIGAYGALEPSWIFYMRRPVVQLTNGQASSWTDSPRRHDWDPRPPEPIARFFEGGDGYVITTRAHLPELKTLPPDIGVLYRLPYFLKNSELVVLGRRAAARNTPRIASPRLFRSSGVGH
ncbi:MAG: hypothetical protein CMJ59_20635 [Planctomycetaceae bacterium]|nr:hypothetical protein [Planctomycetaceae bacterium]